MEIPLLHYNYNEADYYGLGLEPNSWGRPSSGPSSIAHLGAAHIRSTLVNSHSILAYCNGRPPEWWALKAHHGFSAVFRQPLDEHLLPSVALAQRWGLYILLIARSQVHSTLSENLHSTLKLTWASECIQVHNSLPLTGTWSGAPYNGRWSTLISGKISTIEWMPNVFGIINKSSEAYIKCNQSKYLTYFWRDYIHKKFGSNFYIVMPEYRLGWILNSNWFRPICINDKWKFTLHHQFMKIAI
jgi:hypothetical protein